MHHARARIFRLEYAQSQGKLPADTAFFSWQVSRPVRQFLVEGGRSERVELVFFSRFLSGFGPPLRL
jgi:hypothetical protein